MERTALYDAHVKLGAKIVDFAGFEMPISYTSITEEHMYVREKCGIFDVSHMGQLFIYGDDDLTKDLEMIFPLDLQNLKLNSSYTKNMENNLDTIAKGQKKYYEFN